MKFKRVLKFGSALFLSLSSVLALNLGHASMQGAGGGASLLNLNTYTTNSIGSSVQKVGMEMTPVTTWGANSYIYGSFAFADSGGNSKNSSVSASITDTALSLGFSDSNRTGAFVASTDYTNVAAGVNFSSSSNTYATITYTISSIPTDTAQLVSVDLSNTGWIDVYLKSGSGTDTRLISLKAATGIARFFGSANASATLIDSTFTTCSQITGSAEVDVRVLADATAVDLTAQPDTQDAVCGNMDKTSYDAATKTAKLKYDTAGVAVNHAFVFTSGSGKTVSNILYSPYSSLSVSSGIFNALLNGANSSSQQFYFIATAGQDGQNIPKNVPYVIVGGIVDMSSADINIASKGVTLDVSKANYSAFAHNVGSITKSGQFTLYVPFRDGDNFVGICKNAAALTDITSKCSGIYYLKDGQTKTSKDTKSIASGVSVKATIVTVNGVKYWQVDGLTGTGGFSTKLAADPDTGYSSNISSPVLLGGLVVAGLGLAIAGRKLSTKTVRR